MIFKNSPKIFFINESVSRDNFNQFMQIKSDINRLSNMVQGCASLVQNQDVAVTENDIEQFLTQVEKIILDLDKVKEVIIITSEKTISDITSRNK